jgi:hypothetical protein
MGKTRAVKYILVITTEGKRDLGKSRRRWDGRVKTS